ncbi:MAG: hypothetical protein NZ700_12040, partial [Gemmataceae bacterium]|nr:hypothetical protein [Gemmataceae bacterium]MDW8263789.1 hypothetical protein [Gemmataceae bacterium]
RDIGGDLGLDGGGGDGPRRPPGGGRTNRLARGPDGGVAPQVAIRRFEAEREAFVPATARRQALRFARPRFEAEIAAYVRAVLADVPAGQKAA